MRMNNVLVPFLALMTLGCGPPTCAPNEIICRTKGYINNIKNKDFNILTEDCVIDNIKSDHQKRNNIGGLTKINEFLLSPNCPTLYYDSTGTEKAMEKQVSLYITDSTYIFNSAQTPIITFYYINNDQQDLAFYTIGLIPQKIK